MTRRRSKVKAIGCTKEDIIQALDRCKWGSAFDCGAFVRYVRPIVAPLKKMITTEAKAAVPLYETLLTGCRERKWRRRNQVKLVSRVVEKLVLDWIRARQKAELRAVETVREVVDWIEAAKGRAVFVPIRTIAEVLNEKEYQLFADHFRERFLQSLQFLKPAHRLPDATVPEDVLFAQLHAQMVYSAKGNLDAYALVSSAICMRSVDCLDLAEMAAKQKNYDLGLKWVTRGLAIDSLSPADERCAKSLKMLRSRLRVKRHLEAKARGQRPPALDDV